MSGWKDKLSELLERPLAGYIASVVGVFVVALVLWPVYSRLRAVTAATALLLVVLLVAIKWGTRPALLSSLLGAFYLNFYFIPPTKQFALQLADGEDLVGLVAFLVTSLSVGQLSARAQKKARENRELYEQLREAFQRTTQLEAMRQSDKLKSALLDTVTHDLRTPLTSIKAAASALRERQPANSDPESQRALLNIIVQQSDRLNHFIEGMLELAKVESGSMDARRAQTPVDDIISAALVRAEDVIINHLVSIDCQDGLFASVSPKAVCQVVFSLVENAGKYSPPGSKIQVTATAIGDTDLQISVEDEGPGIPAQFREKVFDKFYRRDAESEKRVSGMGLGLAIARGIVEGHGGRIWAEARAEKSGARFVFILPSALTTPTNSAERVEAK